MFFRERQGVEDTESPGRGFSRLGQAALGAGLVPTIKSGIATVAQDNYSVLAIYYGIDALRQLSENGTLEKKRSLAKQILEHDILQSFTMCAKLSLSFGQPTETRPLAAREPSLFYCQNNRRKTSCYDGQRIRLLHDAIGRCRGP